jgi:hypothetical protein
MKNEFIPYEQALALKELGFDESCLGHYGIEGLKVSYDRYLNSENKNSLFPHPSITNNPKISAPLYQQAFRWFRDKHGLFYYVTTHDSTDFEWYIYDKDQNDWEDDTVQNTYEEAELACLKKLIELSTQTK